MQKLLKKWREKLSVFCIRLLLVAMSLVWYLTIIGRLSTTWGTLCEAFFTILQAIGTFPTPPLAIVEPLAPPIYKYVCAAPPIVTLCSCQTQKKIKRRKKARRRY